MAEVLFKEFCNHVYLGQWELARAYALFLFKNDICSDDLKHKLISTVQWISKNPYLARSAWSTLPCPSYVSFLVCKLLEDLGHKDEAKIRKYSVDFYILLEMVLNGPEKVMEELSATFDKVTKMKYDFQLADCYTNLEMTNESVVALKNALRESPTHISLLLTKLLIPDQKEFIFNSVFSNMFFQLLLNSLKSAESQCTKKENASLKTATDKVYLLLSLLPNFVFDEKGEIDKIFLSCLELCQLGALELERVYSSLISCTALLKKFFKLEDSNLVTTRSELSRSCLKNTDFFMDSGNFRHREALLWSINKKSHFLQHFIDTYTAYILNGDWQCIQNQICGVPHHLKNLCLVLSWEKCHDDISAKNLMNAVKIWNEGDNDPVLDIACRKFKLNVSLAEMCITSYKELFPTADEAEIQSLSWRILSCLQTQSVLRVLHSVFGLKNISPERIKDMLTCCQEYHKATDQNASSYLTDEATYSGYIILVLTMEAIHLSCDFKDLAQSQGINLSNILYKVIEQNPHDSLENETENLAEYVQNHGCQKAYSKFVVEKLECAKQKLKNLFPLSFRVEILENVFSMLFLRVQNLVEISEPHYDSDQGHEGDASFYGKADSFSAHSVDMTDKSFEDKFIINKVKLKETVSKNGVTENVSGHLSSKSTESTSSNGFQPHTFLCNELITRDLLSLLKDLVYQVKSETYGLIQSSDVKVVQETSTKMHNDVKVTDYYDLPERTSRLLQYINEALWRYEVVQRDIFQERINLDTHKNKPYLLQSQYSTSSSDFTEGVDKEGKKHRKRKKRKHKNSSLKDESVAESSIIQCMLSPPEALLRYSLWNGNLTQAGQVIKLFDLQSSDEAKELILINELQEVNAKLVTFDKIKPIKNISYPDNKPVSSSVMALKNAISLGLQTSNSYMTIYEELSRLKVLQSMDLKGQIQHPELLLGSENIYSIFLIDLAYVSDISIELASSLLDSAYKSWVSASPDIRGIESKSQSQKKTPLIRGNHRILNMMNNLLKEFQLFFKNHDMPSDLYSVFWPIKKGFRTLPQMLPTFIGNLNHVRFKEEVISWSNTCSLLEEFSVLLEQEEQNENRKKDIEQENKLHMTYKRLSRTLRALRDWSSRTISSDITRYIDYLSKLFIHLRQVTNAALECKSQNVCSGQAIYTSDFSILKESPVELLKKILLQTGVTPEKIEIFAVRMKVDLVRVLAHSCLPYVPLFKENISVDKLLKQSCHIQGGGYPLYVLNNGKQKSLEIKHPDIVARDLMRDLISMIQAETAIVNDSNGIFTEDQLFSVTQHSQLLSWMEDCSELAFVDLDLLQSREEKLAFFVNVTNIAWMYAVLLQTLLGKSQEKGKEKEETKSPDYSESNSEHTINYCQELLLSSNSLERFTVQKLIGFSVGQIGPISLFDLRYQLLRPELPIPKHLEIAPFYKLFDDKKEIWKKYMPVVEPRLLFVLTECLQHSPKLQVMYSEDIDDILEKAMQDYFDFTIHIDIKDDLIVLPQLLEWYSLDFSKDDDSCLDKAPYEGLINLLPSLVRSHLSEKFQELLSEDSAYNFSENIDSSGRRQLPFTVKFKNPPIQFGVMLDYYESDAAPLERKKVVLMDPQPFIINYLKEKCSILTDLYGIIMNENPSQYLTDLNINLPIFNLLRHYNELNMSSNDKYLWFKCALSPCPDRTFFTQQVEFCFTENMWQQALFCLDIYLEYCGEKESNLILAKQMILEHVSSINISSNDPVPSNHALRILDPVCQANVVLKNIHKWELHSALKTLKYCLSDSRLYNFPDIHLALKNKLREINLYKKIVDASEIYGSSEAKDCVYVFNNWQEVADCSVWDQSRIFDFLSSIERYDIAVEWTRLNVINSQQKLTALSMNVLWYLNQDPPSEEGLKILDSLTTSESMKLCDSILPKLSSIESKLYLVQYINDNLQPDNQQYYCNMLLGLKILSSLKSPAKEVYSDLVAHPYLLLEQMLMNVELRDAEKAIKAIENDLETLEGIAPVLRLASVNQLVEDYASKALEVHFLDALLDTSSSSTLVLSIEDSMIVDEPFVMPVRVPTKEEWVPDAKIHRCQVCKEERFNMFSRRHHCRRCGRVVCANCSQHALIVEGYGNVKVRVCEDCYNLMTGSVNVTSSSFDKRYRVLSSMQSSPRNSPYQDNVGMRRRMSSIQGHAQAFRWVLSPDSEQNASVRNEFSYDQAPSISLCFSILRLHRDPSKCAQFMLNLCDRLLGKIKPRRSGKIPVEIDYSLIISMIKSLLMSAKVSCHQVHDSEGEALADLYFQHLDIMKLLVNANCRHLLPREALTSSDTVRKLRDKLLEEERMSLALEVSTKFNLDKTGVWSSWGLFCIRAGDLPAARTKFQQCLKVINDKNNPKQENPLLNKILRVLETSKYAGTEKAAAIYKSLSSLKNIENGSDWLKNENSAMDGMIKKECLFYLNMYGTHLSTVRFYQRNNLTHEALTYIMEKKCDPEIFIEAIFMPMLKNVQLSSLKYDLTSIDPALSSWWNYLLATCRHLERLKYLNVLYEMQLFMEDYVRAAKSAINFFLAPAPSYKELIERSRFLYNAKKHYQKYLSNIEEPDSPTSGLLQRSKNVKILSSQEVERHIEIVTLQEEVLRFLQHCTTQNNQTSLVEVYSEEKVSKKETCPPTLFGNSQKKSQVALMVILNAVSIDGEFELAMKIIQSFGLNTTAILCEAGKKLVSLSQRSQIPHFLACVKCYFSKMVKVDEVILECVSEIHKQKGEVEDIIKMLTSDTNKINAYLMCDKLKSAYLLAIKLKSALDVRRVLVAAEQSGQTSIQRICEKWLETNTDVKKQ